MTKAAALHEFWNRFGIPAYVSSDVPAGNADICPYLTYEQTISNYAAGGVVFPVINVYYRTDSNKIINDKVDEIVKYIGTGRTIKCDDGLIAIRLTSGWQAVNDPTDSAIKRRYTTAQIDFCTF